MTASAHLNVVRQVQHVRCQRILQKYSIGVSVQGGVPQLGELQRPPDLAEVEGLVPVQRPLREVVSPGREAVQVAWDAHLLPNAQQFITGTQESVVQ